MIDTSTVKSEFRTGAPLSGQLLSERLAQDSIRPEDALRYAIDIGSALSRAHSRGEVHGAVSPSAIVISGAGAALVKPSSLLSELALAYRAPEQVLGEAPDWRSDIFSFGALLYELVNGDPAFTGQGAQLDNAILKFAPPPLMPASPIHTAMEGVIAGCLEKDPARRRQRIQNAVIELKLAGRSLPRIAEVRQRFIAATPPSGSRVAAGIDAPALESPSGAAPIRKPVGPSYGPPYAVTAYPTARGFPRARFWVTVSVALLACAASVAAVVLLPQVPGPSTGFPWSRKIPNIPACRPSLPTAAI